MNDEVARWAASRAPDLLRRAEELALEHLTRALIDAALTERDRTEPAPRKPKAAEPATSTTRATQGETHGLWLYCVAPADADLPIGVDGVEADAPVERIEHVGLAGLVSRVPLSQYGEDALRENLNDLAWLERVARSHEAVLERALLTSTIVPLRLCTIYEDREGVADVLAAEHERFERALDLLEGRQEWGVKVLLDRSAMEAVVRASSDELAALEKGVEASSGGGAYMMGRRIERELRALTDRRLAELVDDVHARLQDWADDAVLSAPQNRDLSQHEGEMVLNGAYLVQAVRVGRFRELVSELEGHYGEFGASFELTGPWPPYNFLPSDSSATRATRA